MTRLLVTSLTRWPRFCLGVQRRDDHLKKADVTRYAEWLTGFEALMDHRLLDEEDIVIPLFLKRNFR